jgi:hypothetical protein
MQSALVLHVMDPVVPEPILITDPDDPRVAAYRDIKERDLVGRQGLFVAEGEVVLRLLLRSPLHQPQSVLIAEKRWAALASDLAACAAPVYLASQPVLDAIAGFPMHRGILAIGRTGEALSPTALLAGLAPDALVVCLFGVGNHDNMGGIFRNAAAFGAEAVLLDAPCTARRSVSASARRCPRPSPGSRARTTRCRSLRRRALPPWPCRLRAKMCLPAPACLDGSLSCSAPKGQALRPR